MASLTKIVLQFPTPPAEAPKQHRPTWTELHRTGRGADRMPAMRNLDAWRWRRRRYLEEVGRSEEF